MNNLASYTILAVCLSLFVGVSFRAQDKIAASRIQVKIVTDEADAVLNILAKKQSNSEISDSDWNKVYTSEGYIRLKKRELSMKRPFEDSEFKNFVLSDTLYQRRQALTETLASWKRIDITSVAQRPLAYLPASAVIHATIYPVIKPRENSFVFDIPENPAIFLYLDPSVSREKFENTLAHELHHIGFGTTCPSARTSTKIKALPENLQRAMKWLGGFGEGFAMLAAAGGPDIHPHAVSLPEERARWDKDVANFNNDLKTVESFFLDLANGKLSEEKENEIARSFYGIQGPWYTVGWKMAVVIEKTFGRRKLIECMCDQRELLATYNSAAKKHNRKNNEKLVLWSDELIAKLKR